MNAYYYLLFQPRSEMITTTHTGYFRKIDSSPTFITNQSNDLFPSASWTCYSLSLPVFILLSMQWSLDRPHITPPLSAKKHIFISIIVWDWEVPFFSGLFFYHYSVCLSLHPLFCLWMTDASTFFSPLVFLLNNFWAYTPRELFITARTWKQLMGICW